MGRKVCVECERDLPVSEFPPSIHDPHYEWQTPICSSCLEQRRRCADERWAAGEPARVAAARARETAARAQRAAVRTDRLASVRRFVTPTWRGVGQAIASVAMLLVAVGVLFGLLWLQAEVREALFGDGPPPCDPTYRVDCPE